MEHLIVWGKFVGLSGAIVISGIALTRYADVISQKLGLGHVFIGVIFLGLVTSLPELVITMSALVGLDQPDLGIGNILGSCVFNLFMICLVDLLFFRGKVFARASTHLVFCGALSGIMILIAVLGLRFTDLYGATHPEWFDPLGLKVDVTSIVIIAFYAFATYALHRAEKSGRAPATESTPEKKDTDTSLGAVAAKSLLAAATIVLAGVCLTKTGERMADLYGLGHSFIGTAFLAAVSSMPELVCTVAAARYGFVNMAFANVFGSNIFNVGIIALTDVCYRSGSLFLGKVGHPSHSHGLVGLMGVLITMVFVAALGYRYQSRRRLSPVTLVSMALYAAALALAFWVR